MEIQKLQELNDQRKYIENMKLLKDSIQDATNLIFGTKIKQTDAEMINNCFDDIINVHEITFKEM